MALVLTDVQLKTVSKEVIQIPEQIAALNEQKTVTIAGKADALLKDDANKVFYDNFKAILKGYYDERGEIQGTTYTEYDDQDLDDASAQRAGNLHYPTAPPWVNFQPKIIDSVQGVPTGAVGFQTEQATHPILAQRVSELLTGFDDGGSIDDTLFTAYVIGQPLQVNNGGFSAGQRVIVDSGGISLIALIDSVAPGISLTGSCAGEDNPPQLDQISCEADNGVWTADPALYAQDLTITVLGAALGGLGVGARVRNFHPGYSNAEREGTASPYAPEAFTYQSGLIDSETNTLELRLDNQQAALNSNPASGSEGTEITQALIDTQTILDAISVFESAPASGAGVGRYGDSVLPTYEAARVVRNGQTAPRDAQIVAAFGSAAQNPDGTFSGAKNWLSLFTWIDLRGSKAGGSLFSFYNFDLIIAFIDQKIVQANAKKVEFDNQMIAVKLTKEPTGTNFVTVTDSAGLGLTDAVSIFDDASAILNTTIVSISTNVIELADSVGGLTLDKVARLTKLL